MILRGLTYWGSHTRALPRTHDPVTKGVSSHHGMSEIRVRRQLYEFSTKNQVKYGPGTPYPQLEYVDKIGTPATATGTTTSDNPRFQVVVFSMKDARQAKKLKVYGKF